MSESLPTRYQHQAWAWLRAELTRRLGAAAMAEVWAEYTRLGRIDHLHAARQRCVQRIAMAEIGAASGAGQRIAALRAQLARLDTKIAAATAASEEG
jgi:hypothetical protein